MTGKTKLIEDLKGYFASKGKFLTYLEYVQEEDTPFRAQIVKRHVGTWARLERLIGEVKPLQVEVKPVPVKAPVKTPAKEPVKSAPKEEK
jgi:hypothetical protein